MNPQTDGYASKALVGPIIFLLIIQLLLGLDYQIFAGHLWGPDSYMWLNRVLHLHESGDWANHVYPRVNPPLGLEQHWTRPFDALLYAGAWLGAPLFGFPAALHGWGILVSPLLEILGLICLFRALTPVFGPRDFETLGLLFISQPAVLGAFAIGRPDHQGLLNLLLIVTIGLMLRLLCKGFERRSCYLAGAVSALAVWISVESMLVVLINLVSLGLFWLLEKADFARKLYHYTLALAIGSALALLVERGATHLWTPLYDQLSVVHVVLFALLVAFWAVVETIPLLERVAAGWLGRWGCAALGAIAVLGVVTALFPDLFAGPLERVDDLYRRVRLVNISEFQPVVSLAALSQGMWWEQIQRFSVWLGITLPGIPALTWLLWKTRGPERRFWSYVAVGVVVFLPLALLQLRWANYAVILLLPVYAWLVARLLAQIERRWGGWRVSALRIPVLAICATWFIYPSALSMAGIGGDGTGDRQAQRSAPGCSVSALAAFLNDPGVLGERPRKLLAYTDFGPELLYRTRHSVLSIPSHRPQLGFTDSYRVMSAATDAEARRIIEARAVELILLCTTGPQNNYYANVAGTSTFYDRLVTGRAPGWLNEVFLPSALAASFRLYSVQPGQR